MYIDRVFLPVSEDHASVGFGVGSASPINTESGVPFPENMWGTGVRFEHIQFDEYSDIELRHLREKDPEADLHSVDTLNQVPVGVAYGVTESTQDTNLGDIFDYNFALSYRLLGKEGVIICLPIV